jgi:hypothetical protein
VFFGLSGVALSWISAKQTDQRSIAFSIGDNGRWMDAVAFGPIGGLVSALLGGAAIGLTAGLCGWLINGGAVWLRHRVLLTALSQQRRIPQDFRGFMQHAQQHLLLLHRGGAYAFPHQYFRDRFAEQPPRLEQQMNVQPRTDESNK